MLNAPDAGNRGWQIYQRYVKQGAYMPWASQFGRTCPEPDFAALTLTARALKSLERDVARLTRRLTSSPRSR